MSELPRTIGVINRGIEQGQHPGAQLYVSINGSIVVNEAFGLARDNVPMTTDHQTLWMSAGKPLTAILILQQIERGRLTLEDRIADHIPGFEANGKQAITIRHCLLHTAGFRGPLNNFSLGSWNEIIAKVIALRQEPGWIPGEKAGYHLGSSWFALGEILRQIDGRNFDEMIQQDIFNQLNIEPARFAFDEDAWMKLESNFAPMHETSGDKIHTDWPGNKLEMNRIARPGANARGPISSLARVYESLLLDDRLLQKPSRDSMRLRQRENMFDNTLKQKLDWGFGVMIDSKQYAGEHQYGYGQHASEETFGHSGNQSSSAFADPKHQLVVAWTCNGMPGETAHHERARAINAGIYEDLGLA
ncbi:MAG TPA: serine hydrolase domain-containing protein [Tepidisphaeraceae bacterium]|nr:serine hydrolase domain-containing protein [Tepidisphaeraceae bacterium]